MLIIELRFFTFQCTGVLDAAAHTTDLVRRYAIRLSVETKGKVYRDREPQVFGLEGRLLPYDETVSTHW